MGAYIYIKYNTHVQRTCIQKREKRRSITLIARARFNIIKWFHISFDISRGLWFVTRDISTPFNCIKNMLQTPLGLNTFKANLVAVKIIYRNTQDKPIGLYMISVCDCGGFVEGDDGMVWCVRLIGWGHVPRLW